MEPSEYPDSPFREMFEKWERRLDAIFDRFSVPNSCGVLSGSEPVSEEISDETSVSYVYLSPQNGEDMVPPTQGCINCTLEGESFLSQSPSPETQYQAVSQVTSISGSTLFACETPPPSNAQTVFDVSGMSESHCAPVLDEHQVTQYPVSTAQPQAIHSAIFTAHICQSTQNDSSFLVTGPSLGDERKHHVTVLPPSIHRHGDGPGSGPVINTGTDSEALKAEIVALSFPRHGPDRGKPRFVCIMEQVSSGLTSALGLALLKHDFFPQFASLQFVVAQNRIPLLPVSHTFVVRMAEGREAYGKLRPVRRPWFC